MSWNRYSLLFKSRCDCVCLRRILVTAYPPGPILSSNPYHQSVHCCKSLCTHTGSIVIHHPTHPGYSSMHGFLLFTAVYYGNILGIYFTWDWKVYLGMDTNLFFKVTSWLHLSVSSVLVTAFFGAFRVLYLFGHVVCVFFYIGRGGGQYFVSWK